MGELRTRKRGKAWEWSFEGARIDGKRKPISKGGFRTKAEALSDGTKAKAEYEHAGRVFTPSEISLSDYLDYWLENHVKKNLNYNSYLDYECKVRVHIKPALGRYRLSSIESDVIQRWIDDTKNKGLAISTVKNTLACLSGAMNYAVVPLKYIKYNPCAYVKLTRLKEDHRLKEHRDYICINDDFNRITKKFDEESNFYLPLMLGRDLGTRIGEAYGFNFLEDINFNKHEIRIRHQLKKIEKSWYLKPPKYDSIRTIKMSSTVENLLRCEITKRKRNQLRYGKYYIKTYLLPDDSIQQLRSDIDVCYKEIYPASVRENGELLTPESFKYCARVIHLELGLPLFHYHCLRHTHGTILAENGVSPKTIMERLGHQDIKTTLETYVFNTEKMQCDAMDIFERAVR